MTPAQSAAPSSAQTQVHPSAPLAAHSQGTTLLLNVAHAIDHMFLLIFATAVSVIAADFGFASWEQLMPYGAAAFLLFGLGSIPSGRLGDLWGRRPMMLVFFFGMGISALLAAATQNAWQLAIVLALLGTFASIYHPVGIPMLLQSTRRPGWTIGVNGLSGNLGIALAALSTGLAVKYFGWRAAFAIPGLLAIGCGYAFARITPAETHAPSKRAARSMNIPAGVVARVFLVMTTASATGGLLFNFTTNGNPELLKDRLDGIVNDPAALGLLMAAVYAIASLAQLVVGWLLDRYSLKRIYMAILAMQPPLFLLAAHAEGWSLYALQLLFMIAVFGAIPFTDVLIARYVDDRMRSRVAGVRLAISLGVSSVAVALLGPVVKAAGFPVLLTALAVIAACTLAVVAFLPGDARNVVPAETSIAD
jgi:MFS family permease